MSHAYDVIVIGGGPAGATAGLELARVGQRVLILEKQSFPRFHVGESMMPIGLDLIRRLGLADQVASLPHVRKLGAEFAFANMSDSQTLRFNFNQAMTDGPVESFNIERSLHDKMLLDAARDAGAEVREGVRVEKITRLEHNDVTILVAGEEVAGRWLLDASGQATVIGRHLGIKHGLPSLRSVAYFGHFTGVDRLLDEEEGYPTIVMFNEGWFWIIAINPDVTSCGMVLREDVARQSGVANNQMLKWGIERCPVMARRLRNATFPRTNHCIADFSYRCEPYAGPGYFLIGDAATFVDPIFSTGVALGMASAVEAARLIAQADAHKQSPSSTAKQYSRFVNGSTKHLFQLVHNYYDHSFRELMMNSVGPFQMERAVISLLAGHVFPKPAWSTVWRLHAMQACARLQRFVPLVPRHPCSSILQAPAARNCRAPA